MIKLLLESVNLLILDEPTNHLDMRSKDVLKEAIRDFGGTVIVVSHDREFLDGLVSKVYVFADGHVREHLGGIYDYLNRATDKSVASEPKAQQPSDSLTVSKSDSLNKTSYDARKEQQRQRRKLEKAVEEAEKKVTRLENELKELEGWMATPSGAANPALFESYAKLKEELTAAETAWEEAMMKMEEN